MPTDGIPAADPYIQAQIKYLRGDAPYDPLPQPGVVTLEVLRWFLNVLEKPEPDPARSPRAFHEYRQILYLVNNIDAFRELSRWCEWELGSRLTAAATEEIRRRLSQRTRRSFHEADRLRVADVVALLGKLPKPDPLPGAESQPMWDGEPYDPWVWEKPEDRALTERQRPAPAAPGCAVEQESAGPVDPSPSGTAARTPSREPAAANPAPLPEEPAAANPAPLPEEPTTARPAGSPREQGQTAADTSGSEAPPSRAGRQTRRVPRGELDERAVAMLLKNPTLTFKQLAEALECRPGTLRDKTKCPKLASARASIRAQREAFRGGSSWRDRTHDDDED